MSAWAGIMAASVASLSWLAAYGSRWCARRWSVWDAPQGGRKLHARPTPLLGGLGIGVVMIVTIMLGMTQGWFAGASIQPSQLVGFLLAILILLIGGCLDDRFDLRPLWQVCFPIAAALVVIMSGTTILRISNPLAAGVWSLAWWHYGGLTLPSDALTLLWLLSVTYATKFMDGLDGLVAGQTVIGAGLIALLSLSAAFYQPSVAWLALIVMAAYAGFLPVNLFPAKQFLGEAGSTLAGFALGFLAIVSGAKVATAFMALGIPLVDFSFVVLGRFLRGQSPFRGDRTHLHFKLLRLGLTQRQAVAIFWSLALVFGVAALGLQTRGKLLLIGALAGVTLLLSALTGFMRPITPTRRRGILLLLACIGAGVIVFSFFSIPSFVTRHSILPSRTVYVQGRSLTVEIAATDAARTQGLSDRVSLAPDRGMIFLFERADVYPFWMRRMRFPLDIIWINHGVVVDAILSLPPPKPGERPAEYVPSATADMALELSAGGAEKYGFRIGARVPELTSLR